MAPSSKVVSILGCAALLVALAPQIPDVLKMVKSHRAMKQMRVSAGDDQSRVNASKTSSSQAKAQHLEHLLKETAKLQRAGEGPTQQHMPEVNLTKTPWRIVKEIQYLSNEPFHNRAWKMPPLNTSFVQAAPKRQATKFQSPGYGKALMSLCSASDDIVDFVLAKYHSTIKENLKIEMGKAGNIDRKIDNIEHMIGFLAGAGVHESAAAASLRMVREMAETRTMLKVGHSVAMWEETPLKVGHDLKCKDCDAEVDFKGWRVETKDKEDWKLSLERFHRLMLQLSADDGNADLADYKKAQMLAQMLYRNHDGLATHVAQVFSSFCDPSESSLWDRTIGSGGCLAIVTGPSKWVACRLIEKFPAGGLSDIAYKISTIVDVPNTGLENIRSMAEGIRALATEMQLAHQAAEQTMPAELETLMSEKEAAQRTYAEIKSQRSFGAYMFSTDPAQAPVKAAELAVEEKRASINAKKQEVEILMDEIGDKIFALTSAMLQSGDIQKALYSIIANFVQWGYSINKVTYTDLVAGAGEGSKSEEIQELPSTVASLSQSNKSQSKKVLENFVQKATYISEHVLEVEDDAHNLLEVEDEDTVDISVAAAVDSATGCFECCECCAKCCDGCCTSCQQSCPC